MRGYISVMLLFVLLPRVHAQEIDFGSYGSSYTVDVIIGAGGANGDLDFGYLLSGSGTHTIELVDALEIDIVGVEYLDVFVDITSAYNSQLILDGDPENVDNPEKSMPLTLEAAYSNVGEMANSPAQATIIPVSNGVGTARFQILRNEYLPPGPPPPPPTAAFNQNTVEEIAKLYLYGSVVAGDLYSGSYYGEVTIEVTYELPQ